MVALANLTANGALERSSSLSELNESVSSDPIAKAFLTDDIRVTLMAFWVLGEDKVCVEDVPGGRTSILPVVMVEERDAMMLCLRKSQMVMAPSVADVATWYPFLEKDSAVICDSVDPYFV